MVFLRINTKSIWDNSGLFCEQNRIQSEIKTISNQGKIKAESMLNQNKSRQNQVKFRLDQVKIKLKLSKKKNKSRLDQIKVKSGLSLG